MTIHPTAAIALAVAAALAPAAASATTLIGLTSSNELARFDTANIAGTTSFINITGLDAGDRFVGIDLRPSNNTIYGVTLSNRIYTLNESTGVATLVATLSSGVINSALGYGIDFNPVADFAGMPSLRLVSSAGDNFAVNVANGTVGNAANTIAAGYSGVAYSNSSTAGAPASTALYYLNASNDTLSVASSAFNTPTITTVGALGVDLLRANGFEIDASGMAWAALNVDAGTSLTTGIYTVNLATGAATSVGTFNGTLSGLTVSAVPEPASYAMLAGGLAALGFIARRRRPR